MCAGGLVLEEKTELAIMLGLLKGCMSAFNRVVQVILVIGLFISIALIYVNFPLHPRLSHLDEVRYHRYIVR